MSLIRRYRYGDVEAVDASRDLREWMHDLRHDQRELVRLADSHLRAQRHATEVLAASDLAAAHTVAAEVHDGIERLSGVISDYGTRLGEDIERSTGRVIHELGLLGDAITERLDDLVLAAEQQIHLQRQILKALRSPRLVEARELVRQGLRHYQRGEFDEAERRFRLALDFNSTDHEALMNLGYVAIQRDQSDSALEWFNKALELPSDLKPGRRTRGLLAIARVHFANQNYNAAEQSASRAHDLAPAPELLYRAAVYAILARQPDGLTRLQRAVEANPALFGRAAWEPDLRSRQDEVLRLLSEVAAVKIREATDRLSSLRSLLQGVLRQEHFRYFEGERTVTLMERRVERLAREAQTGSYSSLLQAIREIPVLESAIPLLKQTLSETQRWLQLGEDAQRAQEAAQKAEREEEEANPVSRPMNMMFLSLPEVVRRVRAFETAQRVAAEARAQAESLHRTMREAEAAASENWRLLSAFLHNQSSASDAGVPN